jgi:hypothetical protein
MAKKSVECLSARLVDALKGAMNRDVFVNVDADSESLNLFQNFSVFFGQGC